MIRPFPFLRSPVAVLLLGVLAAVPAAAEREISQRDLRRHVAALADPQLRGREPRTEGSRRAAEYIARAFTRIGLEPRGENGTPFQDVLGADGSLLGRNVCFVLPGAPGPRAAEVVVIGAHYDHLGVGEQGIFVGADDNASGVAAMIELAEHFQTSRTRPARSLLFLAFDNEEEGLRGSEYWVGHPTVPLRDVTTMLCLDMLGRSMMDRFPGRVVAFGTEWSSDLGRLLEGTPRPTGVEVWPLGTEFVGPRSDFLHFGLRRIPYVFFTTGTHSAYHTPRDVPADVDYRSLQSITRLIAGFVERIAAAPERPNFHWARPDAVREAGIVHRIVGSMRENPPADLEPWQEGVLAFVHRHSGRIADRGRATCVGRVALILGTQVLLLTAVESARTSPDAANDPPEPSDARGGRDDSSRGADSPPKDRRDRGGR